MLQNFSDGQVRYDLENAWRPDLRLYPPAPFLTP